MFRSPAAMIGRTLPWLLGLGAGLACSANSKDGLAPDGTPGSRSVVGIALSPAQASLPLGGRQVFSVSTVRADGTLRPMDASKVQWTATGGTITNGSYLAGRVAGLYRVIAYDPIRRLGDTATVNVGDSGAPVLVSVTLSPASATLAPGASQQFAASGLMSDGSTVTPAVTWSATGGTINGTGLYAAGTLSGTYRVIAAAGSVADTAAVTISNPVSLVSVNVTPVLDTLAPGASATFSASGHYSNGHDSSVVVTWGATGGSISASGVYLAGQTAGTYRVIAAASSGAADTAQVVVTSSTPGPTATVLFTEGFEDASVGGRGWYDNTSPAITTAEKHSGGAALEMAFAAGAQMPVKGGALRHKFTASDRVYVRYWVKYSANWVGSGVNYHPHEFYLMNELESDYMGPSATHLTLYIEHNYQNGGVPLLSAQDALNIDVNKVNVDLTNATEQRAVAGCNGNSDGYPTTCYSDPPGWNNGKGWRAPQPMFTNDPASPGYKNLWHKVEAYYQLNSIQNGKGVNDGIAQYWFDGQLVIDKQNVLFRTGAHATMRLNQFLIAPWIGVGSPVAQTMWVDDLVVATGRVP